jgi:3-mercaptopyruvate sulfurtransferase SseA
MRKFLYYIFAIVIGAGLTAGCNSDESLARKVDSPAPGNVAPQPPADGVRRITVTELKDAVDKGAVVIVDTRTHEAYEAEHIKGAINILEANLDSHINELPRDKMIVAYCS